MNSITVSQAFSNAPPRSAAVLCAKGDGGSTDLLLTDWFTWLNMKRNPMISFSLLRSQEPGQRLREGDSFVLAFPPLAEAKRYREAVRVSADDAGPETRYCSGAHWPARITTPSRRCASLTATWRKQEESQASACWTD